MTTGLMTVLSVICILIAAALILIIAKRGKSVSGENNYRALFVMGIIWLPIGIATSYYLLSVMGFIFMMIGIAHRKSWIEEKKWQNMSNKEKKRTMSLLIVGATTIIIIGSLAALSLI